MPKFKDLQEAYMAWLDGDDFPPAPAAALIVMQAPINAITGKAKAPRRIFTGANIEGYNATMELLIA